MAKAKKEAATKKTAPKAEAPKKVLPKKGEEAEEALAAEGGDEDEGAAASESGAGAQAGLAMAGPGSPGFTAEQQSASFKNFRHHPEMENFYRFIYENDLRFEALEILDEILGEKRARKKLKMAKGKAN